MLCNINWYSLWNLTNVWKWYRPRHCTDIATGPVLSFRLYHIVAQTSDSPLKCIQLNSDENEGCLTLSYFSLTTKWTSINIYHHYNMETTLFLYFTTSTSDDDEHKPFIATFADHLLVPSRTCLLVISTYFWFSQNVNSNIFLKS